MFMYLIFGSALLLISNHMTAVNGAGQPQPPRNLRSRGGVAKEPDASTPRTMTKTRKLQAPQCQVTLKEMCISGGQDLDDIGSNQLEGDLEVYHAGSDELGNWQDLTPGLFDWISMERNGCVDIDKKIRPLGEEGGVIRVRVNEYDIFNAMDQYESELTGVCDSVQNGNGELSFTSEGGTVTLKFEKPRFPHLEVRELLAREWPDDLALHIAQIPGDWAYRPLSDARAREIWDTTRLKDISWTKEVFDCDDFSVVYKAAVAEAAYDEGQDLAYAVGVMGGSDPNDPSDLNKGHVVNVYINELGQVKVLEPQNGSIQDGADWFYNPFFALF